MSDASEPTYKVLARKYRPQTFSELVGQDALVRILKNAFEADRIAHAFILTGVRGVGKTTTARLIAKSLNCVGPDGRGEPTVDPCGVCENCVAIAKSMSIDVTEMDAASRTGVDDIRDIIENVSYRAVSSRYRIFIIDEVHMLSKSAFNALLKTLEEPPHHVKFIFATTEIRMVPVTVLSRCQRFDLRRIAPERMAKLLNKIAAAEKVKVSDEALALIIRASEGSARDATSLLDQAISHGRGDIRADEVREMLGLADRGRILDLFDLIMKGDAAGALKELASQYNDGADPQSVLHDLADTAHWLSVVRVEPKTAEDPAVSPDERARGLGMAEALPNRALFRAWQMLLNSLEGLAHAPSAMAAAEMAVIRLTHVADLPTPEEMIRRLDSWQAQPRSETGAAKRSSAVGGPDAKGAVHRVASAPNPDRQTEEVDACKPKMPQNLNEIVDMLKGNGELILATEVEKSVTNAEFGNNSIIFECANGTDDSMAPKLQEFLTRETKVDWSVRAVAPESRQNAAEDRGPPPDSLEALRAHELTRSALDAFPGSEVGFGSGKETN